jgi:Pregnancy-associated plasma protein-A/Secretion system C-terminal sorting domain/Fibronectin type III domain
MKRSLLFYVFLTLLFIAETKAQRVCGSSTYLQQQILADPSLANRRLVIEQQTQKFIAAHPQNNAKAVVTIPVVVHVLYNLPAQNISDSQIYSQIITLNQDFNATNSDISHVPAAFSSVIGTAQINFCLAKQTPNGVPTNGIVRTATTQTSFYANDMVKFSTLGGDDAWDASKYLNIWVCNLASPLLGYSSFPGSAKAVDGVVVKYKVFGTLGSSTWPYNYGRTTTHEVGHWLNLIHVWGDANCGDDLVNDTPTQQTYNFGCPSYPHITCSNGVNGDMFMNFMDYVNDSCMNMFSVGQANRMKSLFSPLGARYSITQSNGCLIPSTTVCNMPSNIAITNVSATSASISWSAGTGAISSNIDYRVYGTSTWTTMNATNNFFNLTGLQANTKYEVRLQSACFNSSSSSYCSSYSFTTPTYSSSCLDAYESNNTFSTAYNIITGTGYQAKICSSTDVDWYKFTTASPKKNFRVDLTNLPADYDVFVYNSNNSMVAQSVNKGTTSESLVKNPSGYGTWYVMVVGYKGAYNTSTKYTIKVTSTNTTLRTSEAMLDDIALETNTQPTLIYPNPASNDFTLMYDAANEEQATMKIIDITGQLISVQSIAQLSGQNKFNFPVEKLSNGMYIVVIQNSEGVKTKRLQVLR